MKKIKKIKLNSRFYLFLAILLLAVMVPIIVVISMRHEDALTLGSGRFELTSKSVIIRDEVCVSSEKYDKIVFVAREGALVNAGDGIAQVFKLGYNEDMLQALLTVQDKILTEQMSAMQDIEDADLTQINDKITAEQQSIRQCIMDGAEGDLLTYETELKTLLSQREEYLKGKTHATETLTALYAEEEKQQKLISEWKSDIVSTASGTVSFYFDGYEQVLCASKLNMINADLIKSVLKGASVSSSTGTDDTLLYRLSNNNHWYLAFVTNSSSSSRLVGGESYTVVCEGYSDRPYTGKALDPVISGDYVTNILEFSDDIGALANVRTVSIEIKQTFDGIEIPSDAISVVNGVAGINVLTGDTKQRVEVVVLADDGKYAIIRAKNEGESLSAGQRFERK